MEQVYEVSVGMRADQESILSCDVFSKISAQRYGFKFGHHE